MHFRVDLDEQRFTKLSKLAEKRGVVAAELACQITRSFIDRQGPRREALQAYEYRLTKRQQDFLWLLHDFQVMTVEQISRLFSDEPDGAYPRRCLQELVHHDLAIRHDLAYKPSGYRTNTVYSLSPSGVYVCEVISRGPRNIRTVRKPFPEQILQPYRLPHHLMTVDVGVSFKSLRNREFGELMEWNLKVEYRFPWQGALRKIIPDGHGLWCTDEFLNSFIVECVRSRQYAHLMRRIRNYNYWQQSKAFEKDEGTHTVPPILFITTPSLHQEVFRAIVFGTLAAHVGVAEAARNLVFGLAVLDDLKAEGPFANIWEAPLQGTGPLGFQELLLLLGNRET